MRASRRLQRELDDMIANPLEGVLEVKSKDLFEWTLKIVGPVRQFLSQELMVLMLIQRKALHMNVAYLS